MSKKVLVIAAHPDDEILGCGGTLARHTKEGDVVHILIVAEGATSRDDDRNRDARSEEINDLSRSAGKAAAILGAEKPVFLGLPDNRLDSLSLLDVVKPIEVIVEDIQPDIVYTHYSGDLNIDHRIVSTAAMTACRPLPGSSVRAIYCFETLSSTGWDNNDCDFRPNRWIDISETMDKKIAALEAYEQEMRPFPHARSLEAVAALARVRGSSVGIHAAEAFAVVREII